MKSGKGCESFAPCESDLVPCFYLFKKPSRCCPVCIQELLDVVDVFPTFTMRDSICLEFEPANNGDFDLVVEAPDGLPSIALRIVNKRRIHIVGHNKDYNRFLRQDIDPPCIKRLTFSGIIICARPNIQQDSLKVRFSDTCELCPLLHNGKRRDNGYVRRTP